MAALKALLGIGDAYAKKIVNGRPRGFTAQINGKQVRRYKAERTQGDAEAELAKALLQIEPEKPKGPGITLEQAADRGTWPARRGSARSRRIAASSTC